LFYPATETALRRAGESLLGSANDVPRIADPFALIVPHAGFPYSGPIAATGYASIRDAPFDTALLVGRSHFSAFAGAALDDHAATLTPLGAVPTDPDAYRFLKARTGFRADRSVHAVEHALEVQLPFLQLLQDRFRMVALLLGEEEGESAKTAGDALADLIDAFPEKRFMIVCSTDLSHFHPDAEAKALDARFRDTLTTLDPGAILNGMRESRFEACGAAAVAATLHAAARRGHRRVTVLDLRNSGDTSGDRSRVVGYLSAVIHSKGQQRVVLPPMRGT
jgi:AmmeMemoRadiSam system protein B